MKFLRNDTRIIHVFKPVDMNDRESEGTAVGLTLPRNFSDKAKACWEYFTGSAFIFEYKNKLIITDEALDLTAHDKPFGSPRWVCGSWDELEQILEETYDDLLEDGMIEEAWLWAMKA